MTELKPCPFCGGKIDAARMRCEYCGTQFKCEEGPVVRIGVVRPGVKTLRANVAIPDYYLRSSGMDDDALRNIVSDEMSHQLAKALVPMLDLKVGHDLQRMEAVVSGRIRILEPGYVF